MNATESERILLVDDEQSVLDGLQRQHRKHFRIEVACGPEAGLNAVTEGGPYAVVVSDYKMPGMNGAEFLAACRERRPDMTRIMLTGQADLTTAIDAVNRGHIFRFLTKPCEADLFREVLRSGVDQHRLINAERLLLEHTVKGSIEVLADVLALTNPQAFGRALRVREIVRQVVARLGLKQSWQYETAALLSQVGLVAVPPDVIERMAAGEALPEATARMIENHPRIAHDLLAKIPKLELVADMIAGQQGGASTAAEAQAEPGVALGSQILAAALEFDELFGLGAGRREAIAALREREAPFHEKILEALAAMELPGQRAVVRQVGVSELRVGMALDQDVRSENGAMIVTKGNVVTTGMLARLRNYAEVHGVPEPIRVRDLPSASRGAEADAA